jgi:hypothetical protein
MDTPDKNERKEKPQLTRDLEERRKVIAEYIAGLRAFLDKLWRKLN